MKQEAARKKIMGAHIIDGEFQSDKYTWSKPGFVPLKITDPMAQPVLWEYAQKRRAVDPEFADDLEAVLRVAGFDPLDDNETNMCRHDADQFSHCGRCKEWGWCNTCEQCNACPMMVPPF